MKKQYDRPLGWTTLEEAKKLVEAGLDPNTADMYYLAYTTHADGKPIKKPKYGLIPKSYTERSSIGVGFTIVDYKPCWSLGALIDMMPIFEYNRIKILFGAHVVSTGEIVLQYFTADTGESIVAKKGKEFIEAVISMILWLLQNDYIKKQE